MAAITEKETSVDLNDLSIKPWRQKGVYITHVPTSAQVMVDTEDCVDRNRGLALEMLSAKVKEIQAKKGTPE